MNTTHWTERLSEYLDGELSAEDQIAIEVHLDACYTCRDTARDLRELGEAMRSRAAARTAGAEQELGGLSGGVESRLKAERAVSWQGRFENLFQDMHLVWAAAGATGATLACTIVVHGMLLFASAGRPDSLAAMLASLSSAAANRHLAGQVVLMPRAYADAVMPAAIAYHGIGDDAEFTLAAVITRDGTVSSLELLASDENGRPIGKSERREALSVLDAASTARFEPARYGGSPIAVNMIWLLSHTTVRGKISAPGPARKTHSASGVSLERTRQLPPIGA